jgi:hypothetical protein
LSLVVVAAGTSDPFSTRDAGRSDRAARRRSGEPAREREFVVLMESGFAWQVRVLAQLSARVRQRWGNRAGIDVDSDLMWLATGGSAF